MTKQVRWQQKQHRLKRCVTCGQPCTHYTFVCDRHGLARRLWMRSYGAWHPWSMTRRGRRPYLKRSA